MPLHFACTFSHLDIHTRKITPMPITNLLSDMRQKKKTEESINE
jgi:hypothetical protein